MLTIIHTIAAISLVRSFNGTQTKIGLSEIVAVDSDHNCCGNHQNYSGHYQRDL